MASSERFDDRRQLPTSLLCLLAGSDVHSDSRHADDLADCVGEDLPFACDPPHGSIRPDEPELYVVRHPLR